MKNIFVTIKGRLTGGLALMGLLIVLTGMLSLNFVNQLNDQLNELSDSVVPTIETTDDLIANLWESAKVANEILASEEVEELIARREEIKQLAEQFEQDRLELLKVVVLPEYIKLINDASREQDEFVEHSLEMAEQKRIELEKEIIAEELLVEFDRTGSSLITMLDEFAIENEDEMRKAEDDGDKLVRQNASASAVNDVLGELFEKDYPVVEAALKLQRLVLEMQDTAGEFLAEEDPNALSGIQQEFAKLSQQSTEYFEILSTLAETAEDREDAKVLVSTFNKWVTGAEVEDALFDSYRDQLTAEALADELTELLETDADNADALLEQVAAASDSIADSADENAAQVVSTAIFGIIICIIVAMVVGALVLLMALKTVLQPINALLERMNDIADGDGDLTQRVNDSTDDELGQLAGAFNRFVAKIQGLVKEIASSSEEMVASTARQNTLSKDAKQGIIKQNVETDSVAAAVNQMTATSQEVSTSAANAAQSSEAVNAESERTKGVVSQSITSVEQLAHEVDDSSSVISSLAEDVQEINKVLDVIGGIAEQTNLLALNAAIEAARAGEQGRGFAVVADEVRTLAARTQQSTAEINDMIVRLRKGSEGAVEAMKQSREYGENSVSASKEAGESLEIVSESMRVINDMNTQIATAAEEQKTTMEELSKNISTISEISQRSMETAEESEQVSLELTKLGEQLRGLVNQFKF